VNLVPPPRHQADGADIRLRVSLPAGAVAHPPSCFPAAPGMGRTPLLYGMRAQGPNQGRHDFAANLTQRRRGLVSCYGGKRGRPRRWPSAGRVTALWASASWPCRVPAAPVMRAGSSRVRTHHEGSHHQPGCGGGTPVGAQRDGRA